MIFEMPIELKITASTYSRSEFIRAAREANDKFGEEAVESMYFPDDEDSENAMFTFKVASVSRLTQTLAFISIQEQVYDVGIYGSGSVPGHEVRFSFSSETEPSASLRINPEVSDNARVKSIEKAMTILRDALNLSANMEAK